MQTIKKRKKKEVQQDLFNNVGEATVPPSPVFSLAVLSEMVLVYLGWMVKDNVEAP